MDYLTSTFNRITNWFNANTNLEYVGQYTSKPALPHINTSSIENHQATLRHAFSKYLYAHEIDYIINQHRRSDIDLESIYADFFANDVPKHDIPEDEHLHIGLQCATDAFRPPQLCRPVHILDLQHNYPFKWQVNAEAPFSTDEYFLSQRPTYGEYIDKKEYEHIDKEDFFRRHTRPDLPDFRETTVPAKFGLLKSTIFSWTRRWHHIIKSGFTERTGIEENSYLRNRFIFPMLLHTKTAIVKKDDPNKMRTIWGCPKPWIIADAMFYWELLAWMKLNRGATPMLWGYETFTGGWMRLNHVLFSSHLRSSFLTLDWSRFDKRAYFVLIRKLMYILRGYLDFNNGYVPTHTEPAPRNWTPNNAIRMERLWLWTLENLFEAPIVLPDGRMYRRRFAGIPSGLYITQLLDSLYNYTMLTTLLSALGFNPKECIIKVQGDDSIIRLGILIPPNMHDEFMKKLISLAEHYFASVISVEKSEIRNQLNGCEVLSYRNHNGFPHRDEIKMLAQFYHTKARSSTPEITMAQAVGFAFASCGNHNRVLYVCKDIYDYYKAQGVTPNRAGLSLVFGDSPDLPWLEFDLSHFPTKQEIRANFFNMDYQNEAQNAKTWPLNFFLFPPAMKN